MKKLVLVLSIIFLFSISILAQTVPDGKVKNEKKNIYSIGIGGIPPYLSGGLNFGLITKENLGINVGVFYLPAVGQWDDTPPIPELKNKNNSFLIMFSPSYYFLNEPNNRWKINSGLYFGVQVRKWQKIEVLPNDSYDIQDGNVIGFHAGLGIGTSFNFTKSFGISLNVNGGVGTQNSLSGGMLKLKPQISGSVSLYYNN